MNQLVFLDTETTGLEPEKHEVWDVAFAMDDGPIIEAYMEHSIRTADPVAMELNHYTERSRDAKKLFIRDYELQGMLKGNTLVAANPTFDRMMLRARWGGEPWHHRSIDIETMAMTVFGWDRPKGMKDIQDKLVRIGYTIPVPDHTASGDVDALRKSYHALRDVMNKATDWHRRTPFSFDPDYKTSE